MNPDGVHFLAISVIKDDVQFFDGLARRLLEQHGENGMNHASKPSKEERQTDCNSKQEVTTVAHPNFSGMVKEELIEKVDHLLFIVHTQSMVSPLFPDLFYGHETRLPEALQYSLNAFEMDLIENAKVDVTPTAYSLSSFCNDGYVSLAVSLCRCANLIAARTRNIVLAHPSVITVLASETTSAYARLPEIVHEGRWLYVGRLNGCMAVYCSNDMLKTKAVVALAGGALTNYYTGHEEDRPEQFLSAVDMRELVE
jgi:hypothetical protein